MAACVPDESGGGAAPAIDLFRVASIGIENMAEFREWLADSGYGPGTGLINPRLYWALHWLSATMEQCAGQHSEELAMAY